jgi:diaminopimelate epimerase
VTDELRFAKYQGTGNDFVMVVDLEDERHLDADTVARLCDRRTGIGADGLIRVLRSEREDAAFEMDYRNADGSIAEMCGNGARCVGKLVYDLGLSDERSFAIMVGDQVRSLRLHPADGEVQRVTVEMGTPLFAKAAIPMRGPAWETFLGEPFDIGQGMTLKASAVSMGNPHLVLFIEDDPDRFHVSHIGPALERHELFPERTNVEFAQVLDAEIRARVWERGSGETMACGSGACAVAVAANEAGLVPRRTVVHFPGGPLEVERMSDGTVELTGAAERVFEGLVDLDGLGSSGPA